MASALLRKSITDLTRRRARTLFTVMTLALAVASVGIFALPPLMDRAMQARGGGQPARGPHRSGHEAAGARPLRDLGALARIPNVAAVEPRSSFARASTSASGARRRS